MPLPTASAVRAKRFISILLIAISLISLTVNLQPRIWGGAYVAQAAQTTVRLNGNFTIHTPSADIRAYFYKALYYVGRFGDQSALFLITSFDLTNLGSSEVQLTSPENVQLIAQGGKIYEPVGVWWPPSVFPGQTYHAEFDFMLSLSDQAKEIDWSYQGQAFVIDLTNTPIETTSATETHPQTTTITSSTATTTTSQTQSGSLTSTSLPTSTATATTTMSTATSSTSTTSSGSLTQSTVTSTTKTGTSSTENTSSSTSQYNAVNVVAAPWWIWLVLGFLILPFIVAVRRRRQTKRYDAPRKVYHPRKPDTATPASTTPPRPDRKPQTLEEWADMVMKETEAD